LNQRTQLNYKQIRLCPIRVNSETGLNEADPNTELLSKEVHETWNSPIDVIEYGPQLAGRIAETGAQTVMVTDVLDRFSDYLSTFALQMESVNLEIALITSALDIA
ncbi:sugar transferase, partial [Bifidobacterium animalis]|nr:sugar transferase [Bifidobacterium animalis]